MNSTSQVIVYLKHRTTLPKTMRKENVKMTNWYRVSKIALICLTAFSFTSTNAKPAQDNLPYYSGVSDDVRLNETGEILISSGPNIKYAATQISNSNHQLFCNSHTATVSINRRLDDNEKETVNIFDITATFNSEKLDFFQGRGLPETLNELSSIDVDIRCIKNTFTIFLIGHSDSAIQNGVSLAKISINLETGEVK